MLRQTLRVLQLALGLGLVVAALLAAPGGATPMSKGTNSVTCSLSGGTTFTWSSGIVWVYYEFDRSDGTATDTGSFSTKKLGGSYTMATPSDAASVQPIFVMRNGVRGKPPATTCTP